jgi:hypothetical protein
MVKAKSRTIVRVADGAGGMMKVTDLRYERGDWPVTFEVPVERDQAERWTRYVRAECERRGWTPSLFGQIERAENSGTITITANGKPQLELVWERKRLRSMKVKVRCAAGSGLSSANAEQFCKKVNDNCNAGTTQETIFAARFDMMDELGAVNIGWMTRRDWRRRPCKMRWPPTTGRGSFTLMRKWTVSARPTTSLCGNNCCWKSPPFSAL